MARLTAGPIDAQREALERRGAVVSIETDAENVDIWTPVAQQVGIPIEEIEIDT